MQAEYIVGLLDSVRLHSKPGNSPRNALEQSQVSDPTARGPGPMGSTL